MPNYLNDNFKCINNINYLDVWCHKNAQGNLIAKEGWIDSHYIKQRTVLAVAMLTIKSA